MCGAKYKVIGKFNCCKKCMVIVIIEGKAGCVMPESEYKRILKTERKFKKKDNYRVA